MQSFSDILTAIKNGVTAFNGLRSTWVSGQGNATSATVTAQTVVCTGQGRLVSYSVTVKGTGAGTINDAATTASVAASNALVAMDAVATGVFPAGQLFYNGLVITPGTGQSINVTYFLGIIN